MDRRSLVFGLLAGGWVGTLLLATHSSPFRTAAGDPPGTGPGGLAGRPSADPVDPMAPGRTINPSDGPQRDKGVPNVGFGTSGANSHAIALSGSIGSGESAVYYFDTDHQRLLVYQYKPGDRGGISLVAARHIDFDLKLEDYRDRSEKTRDQLKAAYDAAFPAGGAAMGEPEMPVKKVEIPGGK